MITRGREERKEIHLAIPVNVSLHRHRLLESVVDIAVSTYQTHISELPSVIDESCVIKANSEYATDSIEHHLNDSFFIRRELVKTRPLVVPLTVL